MIEMIPIFRTLTFLTLGLGLSTLVGRADGQTVTQPDLRVLDFTNAGSTSSCIGNPVTPLCAVETFEACLIRSEWPLCATVGFEPGKLRRWISAGYARLYYHRYEVLSVKTIEAEHIPTWAQGRSKATWRPGDVAVRLWWQNCPPIEECVIETREDPHREYGEGCRTLASCEKYPSPYTYIVRKAGDRWIRVTHYFESDHPERQDFFQNLK